MGTAEDLGSILVVDDNTLNADLLVTALAQHGFKVRSAHNARLALQMVEEEAPDAFLLDVNMPELDGYELCRQLKAREDTAEIPVIFISALDRTDNIIKGFDVGAVDYIPKPFKFREVFARVSSHVTLLRQKREIEMRRQRDIQQFEVIDRLRQQFIGSAAHDLKNPLFVISGYTEVLESILSEMPEHPEDERIELCTDAIKRGVTKMSSLIQDMLDLLQLEAGISLDLGEDTLFGFLKNALQDAQYRAARKQQVFELNLPQEDLPFVADLRRMNRVLENLLSNAFKYTPEGGTVSVNAAYDWHNIYIEVVDTGLGIPAAQLADIFLPFVRINTIEHMQQEGTGLGLSIVHRIIEQHKGTIYVESELGKGSAFRITLPRVW
jgi:two-component system, sensor histidine kinase and response regulator